jgi:hypothetical protein
MPRGFSLGFPVALAVFLAGCGAVHDARDIEYHKQKALLGDRDYLFELTESLGYLDDVNLRLAVVDALDEIGDKGATMALVAAMRSDPDPTVRLAVPPVLARMGARNAIEPLAAMITDDDPAMRKAALAALQQFGDVPAQVYLSGLRSADANIQTETVKALGMLRDPDLVPIFFNAFFDPVTAAGAKKQMIAELGHLGEDGVDCLYHIFLQTPDATMGQAVRRELEASPSDRAARLLAEYDTGGEAFAWDLHWETPRGATVVSGEVVEVNVVATDNASLMLVTDRGSHVHCHFTGHTDELLYIKSEMASGRVRVSVGGSSSYIEEMTHVWADTIQIVP